MSSRGIYLDNDVILLEGLVVEEAVQHILGSSSIPHLQTSYPAQLMPSPICSKDPMTSLQSMFYVHGQSMIQQHAYRQLPGYC